MTPEVIFVEELPHPIARVWMAITDPAELADWLMPNDFEPWVGKRFTMRCPPGPDTRGWVDCAVLELEPPRRMIWSWSNRDDAQPSRVEFHLEPIESGTRLTLRHLRERDAEQRRRFAAGWTAKLGNLRALLAIALTLRLSS